PSFPRKRESRIPDFQIIFEYCCCSKVRIPACAGMTNPSVRKPAPRHSHESGNPGLRTGETFLPDKFPCRQT
ncbi:hypothetical protein EPH22_12300, partial [Neisseria gonorrhoeae]